MGNGPGSARAVGPQLVVWAEGKVGRKVGKGLCWDLAEEALKAVKAKTSHDFGEVKDDSDYAWGTPVQLKDIQPGDVLQLRDHLITTTVVERCEWADGSWAENNTNHVAKRPHHTAIVTSLPDQKGEVETLEQYLKGQRVVKRSRLRFRGYGPSVETTIEMRPNPYKKKRREQAKVIRTTTVSVTGTIWAYRPQAR